MSGKGDFGEEKAIRDGAGKILASLGWEVTLGEVSRAKGTDNMGRISLHDVLLERPLEEAARRLNPWMTDAIFSEVLKALKAPAGTLSDVENNEKKYALLRDGVPVLYREGGREETRRVRLFDFDHPEENRFQAVKEFTVQGEIYERRADLIGFVNGVPLLFMEFKGYDVDPRQGYDDNYTDYRASIPQLFACNAVCVFSNGLDTRAGAFGSDYAFFKPWKRHDESEKGDTSLKQFLTGLCRKDWFMDVFENFITFRRDEGLTKILAQNHQFLGVNRAVAAYGNRKALGGRLGVFWHTQGSGKSFSMLFMARKIFRKYGARSTFLFLTDREELNTQLHDLFTNCGVLSGKASMYIAGSGADLVEKLKAGRPFIFSLIQKFNQAGLAPVPHSENVVVVSDEAHRSQYGEYARVMASLLPEASRIGFTGTPLFKEDHITERTFGPYVSVYNFARALEDGATVPLFYENGQGRLHLKENPKLDDALTDAIEEASLNLEEEEKMSAYVKKALHILTSEPRLRAAARDIVNHYSGVIESGKAMVVSVDKVTCVRMYQYVREEWQRKIEHLETLKARGLIQLDDRRKLCFMKQADMAVVVSQEQNEQEQFAKWGLDITPHRKRMKSEDLEKEFKDPKHPLRMVFVCAMWLTGFDVKCLSVMYMDKPMKAHSLMQAIARANRVSPGKTCGLIVDYAGIVEYLRKALADYTSSDGRTSGAGMPIQNKAKLHEEMLHVLCRIEELLSACGASLQDVIHKEDLEKVEAVKQAADSLCANGENRRQFRRMAHVLERGRRYFLPGEFTREEEQEMDAVWGIDKFFRSKVRAADVTDLAVKVNRIVSDNVTVYADEDDRIRLDISAIDFDSLREKFRQSKAQNLLVYDLMKATGEAADQMLRANDNAQRQRFSERYQEIIKEYNEARDRRKIREIFEELTRLTEEMNEEQQRAAREGFHSEEELALYDMILKKDLSKAESKKLKTISIDLLQTVKRRIEEIDHWADKEETQDEVKLTIRDFLFDHMPEEYSGEECLQYQRKIYDYIYRRFGETTHQDPTKPL